MLALNFCSTRLDSSISMGTEEEWITVNPLQKEKRIVKFELGLAFLVSHFKMWKEPIEHEAVNSEARREANQIELEIHEKWLG